MRFVLALGMLVAVARAEDAVNTRKLFLEQLHKTYSYLPADVTQEVRDQKLEEMKAFFKFFGSNAKEYLPFLREALRDQQANRWLCFDGSGLLISHSKTTEDYRLAVAAIARCRLKDISQRGYFSLTHLLSRKKGVNTYPIIVKMLENPEFGFDAWRHSIKIGQRDAVALCLLCQDDANWVKPLAARLATEKDPVAQKTIVFALAVAVDPAAEKAIVELVANKEVDAGVREFAGEMLKAPGRHDELPEHETKATRKQLETFLDVYRQTGRMPAEDPVLIRDAVFLVRKADVEQIRLARRAVAARVSDESLYECGYLTMLLRAAVSSPE